MGVSEDVKSIVQVCRKGYGETSFSTFKDTPGYPVVSSNVRISVQKISELVIDLISSRRAQKSYFTT